METSSGHHAFCLSKGFSYKDFCILLLKYLYFSILNTLRTPTSHYTATALTVWAGDGWVGVGVHGCSTGLCLAILNSDWLLSSLRWATLVGGLEPNACNKSLVRFSPFHFPVLWNQKGKCSCLLLTLFNTLAKLSFGSPLAQPCCLPARHARSSWLEGSAVLLLVSQHIM